MKNGVEFVCEDCECGVFAFGADRVPDPPLCATCQWAREHLSDPGERARFRERMSSHPFGTGHEVKGEVA